MEEKVKLYIKTYKEYFNKNDEQKLYKELVNKDDKTLIKIISIESVFCLTIFSYIKKHHFCKSQ